MSFCQVVIETVKTGKMKYHTKVRACKNYARKGMSCCWAHRNLENNVVEPIVKQTADAITQISPTMSFGPPYEWPTILEARERLQQYPSMNAALLFFNSFVKNSAGELYSNRLSLLMGYELILMYPDIKDNTKFAEVIMNRLWETPEYLQKYYKREFSI